VPRAMLAQSMRLQLDLASDTGQPFAPGEERVREFLEGLVTDDRVTCAYRYSCPWPETSV
ncbi:MAG: hypothetical protein QGG57_07005, partial [Candidatus Poseidoniia archaeon]|nr:hypothetical protein [Candidatus Poseidoniia archaeon]